jgi:hypothetical protein
VGGRAVAAEAEEGGRSVDRVGDVVLVVGAVEVLTVPAADGFGQYISGVERILGINWETYVGK